MSLLTGAPLAADSQSAFDNKQEPRTAKGLRFFRQNKS
jgi:hypothetical protein